jgi:HEAT repeat protein/cyclophilin family peptidyl-prolyl cis-trans isomerase
MMARRVSSIRIAGAAILALLGSRCATAPPVAAPTATTFDAKMSAILRLEDQRVLRDPAPPPAPVPVAGKRSNLPPPTPPPDLISLLGDPESRVRRRAALAVGRVGLGDGVGPLTQLLAGEPDAEVKQMAAFALGLIGDRSAIEPLRAALNDNAPIVRGRAAEALGLLNDPDSATLVAQMVRRAASEANLKDLTPDEDRYPLDPSIEAFRLGVYALARLKNYDALRSAVLDERGLPITRWWPVAYALQRIDDPKALQPLVALLDTEGHYTRLFAIKGVGALKGTQASATLLQYVSQARSSPALAIEAIRALGRLGSPEAVPALARLGMARESSAMLRAEAVAALGQLGYTSVTPLLQDLLSDQSPFVRGAAIKALSQVDRETFIAVVSTLDPDKNWTVRAALASALASLDRDLAAPRLTAMLDDSDQRVIPTVLASLSKIQAPDLERILLARLQSDDVVVRMAAATELGKLKPESGVSALLEAIRFADRDNAYVARAAALGALAEYGAPKATDALKAALTDKDWAVRVRAAELLKRLDPNADVSAARPAPTAGNERYSAPELLNPSVSPHVYIDTDKGTIQLELAVLDAPFTSQNFITLARKGFFTGLAIHRVVPNFVVQDGDPRGDGEGGPGYTIRDELNERPYLRGTLGMALDWRDTGGSQFFITHGPQPHLDARYTVFGNVVSGMDVVDRLEPGDVIRRVRVWDGQQMSSAGDDGPHAPAQ